MTKQKKYEPTKSKTTAVITAVLFGLFSWTYTYKTDAWKFWLNIVLAMTTMGLWGIIAWIWAVIDQSTKEAEYYKEYYNW